MGNDNFIVKIEALTDIWTGNENRKNTILRETGIIGSLRWWYEALVRGLGGTACDPTGDKRCELSGKKKTLEEQLTKMCPACYLFGCGGWARKFKLDVLDNNGNLKTTKIEKKDKIGLKFTPLRATENEEWALLNLTLHLIAGYGAIGGKTVFKPSDENIRRDKLHHQDFGLFKIINSDLRFLPEKRLKTFVKNERWRKLEQDRVAWVSIQNFWCVKGKYLSRKDNSTSSFNKVLGRKEQKNRGAQLDNRTDEVAKWLAGSQQGSKKVFSFKNPPRTFGFVNPDIINFKQMKKRLENIWGNENNWIFLKGNNILSSLMQEILED